jgi:hypothetical protein
MKLPELPGKSRMYPNIINIDNSSSTDQSNALNTSHVVRTVPTKKLNLVLTSPRSE